MEEKRGILRLAAGRASAAAFTEEEASTAEGEAPMAEEGVTDEKDAEPMVIPIEGD
jgi:hypothetical protein